MCKRIGLSQAALGASLLIATVASFTACRCQSDDSVSAALWSATEPFRVEDGSLTDYEYVALGLASSDHNWDSEELKDAAVRLQTLATTRPEQLPRYHSPRSGRTFTRITTSDNLAVLRSPSVPISIRLSAAADYSAALGSIVKLYVVALNGKKVSGDDMVELFGARLRTCQVVLEQLDEFLSTLSKADPTYHTRMEALDKMRVELSEILMGAVRSLSEPRFYGLPARKKLVGYCNETFVPIVASLTLASRQELLGTLTDSTNKPSLANLQPQLGTLRDRVARAVAGTGVEMPSD